ncbi:MAG TPA: OmpA family protein, partial [Chthoniobacterales bacterium]|nr:OmpA family protein [Chthoniobacterales bacterium]
AAENMGVNISLEVRAYGDAIATEGENAELSRRRAEAVRKFLGASGVDEQKIAPIAMGMPPPPAPGEKSGAGKFDRRVFFRVVIQP